MRTKPAGAAFSNQNARVENRFQALKPPMANHHRKANKALLTTALLLTTIFQSVRHADEAQCQHPLSQ